MKKRRLAIPSLVVFALIVVALVAFACGPAGPAGPPGPVGPAGPAGSAATAAKSRISLAAVPAVQEASAGKSVTFIAAGLDPKQSIRLRVSTTPELDITMMVGDKPPQINSSGTFEVSLDVSGFPAGTYTVSLLGAGDEVLATTPLKVFKSVPPKPTASPKPTATPTATPPPAK